MLMCLQAYGVCVCVWAQSVCLHAVCLCVPMLTSVCPLCACGHMCPWSNIDMLICVGICAHTPMYVCLSRNMV